MNRYKDHIYVIPEDGANEQIANGFVNHHSVKHGQIQVMPAAGGWSNVLTTFQEEYITALRNYPLAHVVMVIDFDEDVQRRRARFQQEIPDNLKSRVFVIGSRDEPETLKRLLNIGFEKLGESLANDCDLGIAEHWNHEQLQHNDPERQRLFQTVRPFVF